jgi:hypothetical protein
MARKRKPKIVERKLGKERAWGIATYHYDERKRNVIEIDPRLSARRHLEVMCHEALHLALPHLTDTGNDADNAKGEAEVDRLGKIVSEALWLANYRRVHLPKHTTPVRISVPKKSPKRKSK